MRKGVQRIYAEVARTYELVNHVLTFGLDHAWRNKAAKAAARSSGRLWMDVCCGTGEMAQTLSRFSGGQARVVGLDFSFSMLGVAQKKDCPGPVSFVLGDGIALPFPDSTFDLITIAFATRNLNIRRSVLVEHLREFHRVLRPGGCFYNLETSQPRAALVRRLFHLYVRLAVRSVGTWLSGSKPGYRYLSHTIPRFYPAEELATILLEAGFSEVSHQSYFLGITALHAAVKSSQEIRKSAEA